MIERMLKLGSAGLTKSSVHALFASAMSSSGSDILLALAAKLKQERPRATGIHKLCMQPDLYTIATVTAAWILVRARCNRCIEIIQNREGLRKLRIEDAVKRGNGCVEGGTSYGGETP